MPKKTGNINRNIQSMTRLCNIAPIHHVKNPPYLFSACKVVQSPEEEKHTCPHPPPPPTRVRRRKYNLVWMKTREWQSQPDTYSKFHTNWATSQESWKKIVIKRGIIHFSLTPDELTANNELLSVILSYPVQKAKRWTTEKNKTNKTKSLPAANKTQKKETH